MTRVSFDSAGIEIAAHLYTPDSQAVGPRPALVVGHPGTGVKEQTSGTYAALMAERGFVTLAFDAVRLPFFATVSTKRTCFDW